MKKLSDLTSEAEGRNTRGYARQFEGKEVTWVLRFEKTGKDKDGNEFLQFGVEPFDVGNAALMLSFKPAPGTSEGWKATPPGERVKISAVVTKVAFANLSPGNDPGKALFIGAAVLENVRRVSD